MSKKVILTGIRANNDLHIGNYFGAILPIVDMAKTRSDEFQVNLFIPDLHSFTTPIDHNKLQEQVSHAARLFVAAGLPLTHDSIHVYRQSYISAHSELAWILSCFTGFNDMSRMTQFKDKSSKATIDLTKLEHNDLKQVARSLFSDVSVGLFNYPVLMAADILLYSANYVPVGDDQTQHLEYTRDIAQRLNSRFGELFVVPEPVVTQHEFFGNDQGLRIKDLQDPTKKMSKSDDTGKGVIFLGDDPELASKKVMSATTDDKALVAFDPLEQPGISNLLQIEALLSGDTLEAVIERRVGQESYGDFKREVAEKVKMFLIDFQSKLNGVDDAAIMQKLALSEQIMNQQANQTLLKVQKAVGLRPQG